MSRIGVLRGMGLVYLGLLILSGCSTNKYSVAVSANSGDISSVIVQDQRTELSKAGGTEQWFTTIYYHGDKGFEPSKLDLFKNAVLTGAQKRNANASIVLKKFDVIDSAANRQRRAMGASLAGISYPTAIIVAGQPSDSDFIACSIEAVVDGQVIAASAVAPYRESSFAMNVFKDASYVAAVDKAVQLALNEWIQNALESLK